MNDRQKKVKKAIEYLKKYIVTYEEQFGYLDYSDEIIINDILYGLGAALDGKYKFASGFDKFKERLREHLTEGDQIKEGAEYTRFGKKYRKIGRNEIIETGAMQSWCNGELQLIMNDETIGDMPSNFSDERDFYNPIN